MRHLETLQCLSLSSLLGQRHADIALQHGGAAVDGGGVAEVDLRLHVLLLPVVDLADAIPTQT